MKTAILITSRPIRKIALDICNDWTPEKMYFGARPYVQAMLSLDSVDDIYGCESGDMIVRLFLANAQTWRGETANRIKKELKELIK